jgi:hypothetical protein
MGKFKRATIWAFSATSQGENGPCRAASVGAIHEAPLNRAGEMDIPFLQAFLY